MPNFYKEEEEEKEKEEEDDIFDEIDFLSAFTPYAAPFP